METHIFSASSASDLMYQVQTNVTAPYLASVGESFDYNTLETPYAYFTDSSAKTYTSEASGASNVSVTVHNVGDCSCTVLKDSSVDWITPSALIATGDTAITLNISENNTEDDRNAEITINFGGDGIHNEVLTITQNGGATGVTWSAEPLTFIIHQGEYAGGKFITNFAACGNTIDYQVNDGEWITASEDLELTVFENDQIRMRCIPTGTFYVSTSAPLVTCELPFEVAGNILSLEYGSNFTAATASSVSFRAFFKGCGELISAENLVIPVFDGQMYTGGTYNQLFRDCISLTTAPSFYPYVSRSCYTSMFQGCVSLTGPVTLPATSFETNCYSNMFKDCTSFAYLTCLLGPGQPSLSGWLSNTASEGTFVQAANHPNWASNAIPSGWTVLTLPE